VVWVVTISVHVLGEVLELLSEARLVVCPEEGPLLGVVSVPYHEDVICLSWNPGSFPSD
jgi:hypothetical protein